MQLVDSGTKLKMPGTSIANWSHHCISDLSAKASEESKPLLPTPAGDRRKFGPRLGPPPAKGQSHLVHDPPCDSHAVEDGDVDDSRHAPIVDGLGAVGPHVRTLGQVDVTGAQTETDRTVLQETESGTAMMRHNRRKSHQGRPESQPGLGTWPHSTPCSEEASRPAGLARGTVGCVGITSAPQAWSLQLGKNKCMSGPREDLDSVSSHGANMDFSMTGPGINEWPFGKRQNEIHKLHHTYWSKPQMEQSLK